MSTKDIQLSKAEKKAEYNKEPVIFCAHCLSLKIRVYDDKTSYCDECSSTTMELTSIEEWEKLYEQKYKKKFLNTNTNQNGRS